MSVRHGLLALLARAPMHGYQLRQEFLANTADTWSLNIGQVYTTLARLERDGYIETTDDSSDDHRIYKLSEPGRTRLREWFSTPVPRSDPPRDELAIKVALAISTPDVDAAVVIQTQRVATIRAMREQTKTREQRIRPSQGSSDIAAVALADASIFRIEAELRWLDHCELLLERHAAEPNARPVSERT